MNVKQAKCPKCKKIWNPPDRYHPIADVKDGYLVVMCPPCGLKSFNKACADDWKDPLPELITAIDYRETHARKPKCLLI